MTPHTLLTRTHTHTHTHHPFFFIPFLFVQEPVIIFYCCFLNFTRGLSSSGPLMGSRRKKRVHGRGGGGWGGARSDKEREREKKEKLDGDEGALERRNCFTAAK